MTRSQLAVALLGGVLLSFILYNVFGQYTPIAATTSPDQTSRAADQDLTNMSSTDTAQAT